MTSLTTPISSNLSRRGILPWLRRIRVLAGHTFTQLVRMKVFYFLMVFSVVLFVAGFVLSSVSVDAELKLVKDTSFGVMQIFSALFGIVGMALLLPKDIEDRTLYTILSKPVRRYEYVLGKYLGVLLVLLVSLLIMDVLSSAVLHLKYTWAINEQLSDLEAARQAQHWTDPVYEDYKQRLFSNFSNQGLTWGMHLAVLAIFLKSAVITAVAMAVSTFAGSTIFTMLAALSIYVIGHLQASARETLLAPSAPHIESQGRPENSASEPLEAPPEPPNLAMRIVSGGIAVVFPDFQVFNVVDAVVIGTPLKAPDIWKMIALSLGYVALYLGVSVLLFSQKEL